MTAVSLSEVYIDSRDNNSSTAVNEYVSQTIQTKDLTHLFIYYYSSNGARDFADIKNTFKIYKIESEDVKANI